MTDNSKGIISLKKVNKGYAGKQVIFDVNLNVPFGEIFGLLGPSGCGKTTLVKMTAGILRKDSGDVTVLGEDMPSLSAMKNIGYMAQRAALYPVLTGKENLKFFGKLYGLKGKKLESRVQYVAELVNLTYELDKKTSQYSGGMLQRLSLAVALIAEPEVLLLDEPTVGIDPLLRQDIWQELRNLANMGVTILITTHVMDEAEKCDSLAMMREGKILATGTAGELISLAKTDTIEEAFIYFSEEGGEKNEN